MDKKIKRKVEGDIWADGNLLKLTKLHATLEKELLTLRTSQVADMFTVEMNQHLAALRKKLLQASGVVVKGEFSLLTSNSDVQGNLTEAIVSCELHLQFCQTLIAKESLDAADQWSLNCRYEAMCT